MDAVWVSDPLLVSLNLCSGMWKLQLVIITVERTEDEAMQPEANLCLNLNFAQSGFIDWVAEA